MDYCSHCGVTTADEPVMLVLADDLGEFRVCSPDYREGVRARRRNLRGLRVEFSSPELQRLRKVAAMVTEASKHIANPKRFGLPQEDLDLNGLQCEWAVARELGIPFKDLGMLKKGHAKDGGADLVHPDGRTIQVKGTKPTEHWESPRLLLKVEAHQELEWMANADLFVLVALGPDRTFAVIRGVISGQDFRQRARGHKRRWQGKEITLQGVEAQELLPFEEVLL